MTPTQLSRIATLLYGDRWQSSLARDLDVNIRTVQRWAVNGAPDWARDQLGKFAAETIKALREVM